MNSMNRVLYWVGISPSDVQEASHLFDSFITIIGNCPDDMKKYISYEKETNKRVNYNNLDSCEKADEFIYKTIELIISENKYARFISQDQLNFNSFDSLKKFFIYNNDIKLNQLICNKAYIRDVFKDKIDVIQSILLTKQECNYKQIKTILPNYSHFVCQSILGSGGHQTIIIDSPKVENRLNSINESSVLISGYLERTIPVNQHILISQDNIHTLPVSIQIITKSENGNLLYSGGDFSGISILSSHIQKKISDNSKIIGNFLKESGYLGIAGIDYLVHDEKILFVEINPRFQSSSRLLNVNLVENNLPTLYELHMMAFDNKPISLPDNIKAKGSFLIANNDGNTRPFFEDHIINFISPDTRASEFSKDSVDININSDGLNNKTEAFDHTRLFSLTINKQIIHCTRWGRLSVNYAVKSFLGKNRPSLANIDRKDFDRIAKLKFELFCHGLKITNNAINKLKTERDDLTIRDGIAGGLELVLFDNIHINVPIKEYFSALSPYQLDFSNGRFQIVDEGDNRIDAEIVPIPYFVGKYTSKGTPMVEVGQMMSERLSIEIFFGCVNTWKEKTACAFCELGAEKNMRFVDANDIKELVTYCKNSNKINMRHILISGGTLPKSIFHRYTETLKMVRQIVNIPIYIMMAPPEDLSILDEFKEAGLNEIAFNLEFYNRDIAKELMPSKGTIPKEHYFNAFDYAVKLFGDQGQVRSLLMVGIESLEETLQGIEELASRKVMPILSPFRPTPNTPMQNHPVPSPQLLFDVWQQGEKIVQQYNLCLGPTCIACLNNTIALPINEKYTYY
jgi:uncharacterized radical SAM superfamily protein